MKNINNNVSNSVNKRVFSLKIIPLKKVCRIDRGLFNNCIKLIGFDNIFLKQSVGVLFAFIVLCATGLNLVGQTVFPVGYEGCYLLSTVCTGFVTSGRCKSNFNSNQVVSSSPMQKPNDNGFRNSEETKCGLVWVFGFPTKKPCGGPNAIDACDRPSYM